MVLFNDILTHETFADYVIRKEMDDFLNIISDVLHNYDELDFVNAFDIWGSSNEIQTDYNNRQIKIINQHNDKVYTIVTFLGNYEIKFEYKPTFNLNIQNIHDYACSDHRFKFKVKQLVTPFVDILQEGAAWNHVSKQSLKKVLNKIKTDSIDICKLRFDDNIDLFIDWCKHLFKNNKNCVACLRKSYFNDLFDGQGSELEKFYNVFKLKNVETGYYQIIKRDTSINEDVNFNDIRTNDSFAKTLSIQADIKKFLYMFSFDKLWDNTCRHYRDMLEEMYGTKLTALSFDDSHINDGYLEFNNGHTKGSITFLGNREIKLTTDKSFHLTNDFLQYNGTINPLFKIVELYCGNQIVRIGSSLVDSDIVTVKQVKRSMPKLTHARVYHINFSEFQDIPFEVIETLYDICSGNDDFLSFDIPNELLKKHQMKILKVFRLGAPCANYATKLYKRNDKRNS